MRECGSAVVRGRRSEAEALAWLSGEGGDVEARRGGGGTEEVVEVEESRRLPFSGVVGAAAAERELLEVLDSVPFRFRILPCWAATPRVKKTARNRTGYRGCRSNRSGPVPIPGGLNRGKI